MKKGFVTLIIILIILIILFSIRLLNPREIDDVTPAIFCEQELLEKSDILFVIPKFNNISISENPEWCDYILSLNKTLGLHGVYHTYWEFKTKRDQEYLQQGINEFKSCFGYEPEIFKAPNLRIIKENKGLVKESNLILKPKIDQFTHKVYHCNNSGIIDNKIIDIF